MRHYRVTLQDVFQAHEAAMRHGGRKGLISQHAVESAIGRPYSGYHRTIAQKSAALLEALVNNHGFIDGNKRTALLVTDLFIRRSGYVLMLREGEFIDDLIVSVAEGATGFNELLVWFRDRLNKR